MFISGNKSIEQFRYVRSIHNISLEISKLRLLKKNRLCDLFLFLFIRVMKIQCMISSKMIKRKRAWKSKLYFYYWDNVVGGGGNGLSTL